MLFLNDRADAVMRRASAAASEPIYDFDLMLGGGHVSGRRIGGSAADSLAAFIADETGANKLQFAVGDGNHSLAAARKFWLEKRETLDPVRRENDPARYALVELVNIHDPAITFEPIHRVLFHTDSEQFLNAARQALGDPGSDRYITLLASGAQVRIPAKGDAIGHLIELSETFCRNYTDAHGGEIDYIHGDQETITLASQKDAAGILLPRMEKEELFSSVEQTGPFPKKSFSIGLGPDKRYYLECRKL